MKVVGHWYWCAKYFATLASEELEYPPSIPDDKKHLNARVRLYNFEDGKFIEI